MGFLKKITRPISRVLDKIVPNEIKPALPFLAAAAPFMAPGIMGAFGNSMLSRGLISGGLNLGSQLAQEGSDGDFSGLSTLMAAATGALSTPGSAGGRTIGDTGKSYSQYMGGDSLASTGTQSAGDFFKNKAAGMDPGFAKSGLGALEKSSNYLTGVGETLRTNPFSMEGLKAGLVPIGQGVTDLAVAENRRALKDYEREQADYEAGMDEENSNRAFAIRQSMEAYGFTEQEILDAIEAAGYRAGGRVGLANGGEPGIMGNPAVMEKIENMREFMIANPDIEDITDYSEKYKSKDPDFEGIKGAVKEINKDEMLEVDAYSTLLKNVDTVYEKVGIPSSILQEHSDWESEKLNMFDTMSEYKSWLDTNYPKSPIGTYLYHLPKEEKMDIVEKISIKKASGGRVGAEEGGLMNLGGKEMDMRGGGFVPIGKKEKADDVPARLSKNEFVMTADAVRAAGGGSVNEGAKRMYETMNKLEARA